MRLVDLLRETQVEYSISWLAEEHCDSEYPPCEEHFASALYSVLSNIELSEGEAVELRKAILAAAEELFR